MTQVSTHLFYGLFVTTPSLLIASEAFTKIQPCFLAINLIQDRQLKSQLNLAKGGSALVSALTKFPGEVWSLIKDELIGIELEECERRLIKSAVCDRCEIALIECDCGECWIVDDSGWQTVCDTSCELCREVRTNFIHSSENSWLSSTFTERAKKFLSIFNLDLIERVVLSEPIIFDSEPLSAITIKNQIVQDCHHFEESTPFHAITTLSPSDFELPFSVEFISRQFKLLQKVYGIEVSDYKKKIERSQKPQVVPKMKVAVKDVDSKAVEKWKIPSWTLWTEGENGW